MSTTLLPIGTSVVIGNLDRADMEDLNGLTAVVESYPDDYERIVFGAPEDAHYVVVDNTGERVGIESRHMTVLTEEAAA